jgi:hypothetical protein
MRARGIKPGFFVNADLVQLPPLTRILFIGLWCMADRMGRLKDSPMTIKLTVLPGDVCDVDAMLDSLAINKFIIRYQVDECRYIQVQNFKKHQSPHIKERDSTIPAPDLHQTCTVQTPDQHPLTPDSGLLTPEENILSDETPDQIPKITKATLVRERFAHWKAVFPEETARMTLTKDRARSISARLTEGIAPEIIDEAVTNARDDPWWNGAQDGKWKADIKSICGKGSNVEKLLVKARSNGKGPSRQFSTEEEAIIMASLEKYETDWEAAHDMTPTDELWVEVMRRGKA